MRPHPEVAEDLEFIGVESCEKLQKLFEHAVTKFGVMGLKVQEGELDMAEGLAKEVVQYFIMLAATLSAIADSARANKSLSEEICQIGDDVVTALVNLGEKVGQPDITQYCGVVIEKSRMMKRVSLNNKISIKKKLLKCCTFLRDSRKELDMSIEGDEDEEKFAEDEWSDFGELTEEEKVIAVEVSSLLQQFFDLLKSCITVIGTITDVESRGQQGISMDELLAHWQTVNEHADELATCFMGDADLECAKENLEKLDALSAKLAKELEVMDVSGTTAECQQSLDSNLQKLLAKIE